MGLTRPRILGLAFLIFQQRTFRVISAVMSTTGVTVGCPHSKAYSYGYRTKCIHDERSSLFYFAAGR